MRYSLATPALLVIFACQAEATSQRIEIAPPSGEVGFRAYKLGLLPIDGKFTRFDGWLSFDPHDRTSCRVELRVEVASLQTDDREVLPVVTGPDFMDAANFPLLQFAGRCTGHEIGGTLGIAVFTSIAAAVSSGIAGPAAATGIADAFLVAAHVALAAGAAALVVLPAARTFLPKLRLSPQAVPTH